MVDRDNRATEIERDANGQATAIVAPGGARTELDVNAGGYATEIRDSAGAATELSYDAGGLMTELVDRRGGQHTFDYDGDGRLTGDDGPSGRNLTFTRAGDTGDTTVTKTTAAGRQTLYRTRLLADGGVEQTLTDPAGGVTTQLRKPDGTRVLTKADGTEVTSEFAPDPRFGLSVPVLSKEVTTTPGGRTSTRTFTRVAALSNPTDPFSFTTLTETTNLDGRVSTSAYTKSTRTFLEISAGNRRVTTTLDAKDRVSQQTQGTGRTPSTLTYDPQGRVTGIAQGSLLQTFDWDSRDLLASSIDAAGRGSDYTYDDADRLETVTDGVGGVSQSSYDAEGALTGVTEPSGAAHSMSVDGYSEVTGYTPPGGAPQQTFNRDQDGLNSAWNQGAGHTGTVARDSGGRQTAINGSGDASTFTYVGNTDRQATASTDRTGTAQDQALALQWDSDLMTKLTFSGPPTTADGAITLTYDGRDNLTQRRVQSGADDITTNLTYDLDDLRIGDGPYTFTRGGALGELTRVDDTTLRTDYAYDGLGRQTTVVGKVPNTTTVFSQTHGYDNGDKLATRDESFGGPNTHLDYEYDDAGRLTKVKRGGSDSETYGYDPDGNRTSRTGPGVAGTETATYDAQGRLATRGALTYAFDAAGYLTQRGADTFNYGPQGRLLSANVSGVAITYAYDGLGRRTARTDSGGTEQYLYGDPDNPWEVTASRDPSGNLTQYFYDPDGRLIGLQRGAARFYVFTDTIGSPRLVTNSAGVAQSESTTTPSATSPPTATRPSPSGSASRAASRTRPRGCSCSASATTSPTAAAGPRATRSSSTAARQPVRLVGNDPVDFVDPNGTDGVYNPAMEKKDPGLSKYPNTPEEKPCADGPPKQPDRGPTVSPAKTEKKKLQCADCTPITPPVQSNKKNGY